MKKEHTSIRLDPAVLARLKDMAQERSTTATALIDLAIERFLADETVVGELRGMEERLAATIVRGLGETTRAGDDVQLVIAQVDQLIRFMFQVTPEVFEGRSSHRRLAPICGFSGVVREGICEPETPGSIRGKGGGCHGRRQ
ncbi:putative transcriptional regulator [Paraburkholderia youngii]|uniref:hypothetical protein n=1 Tax=Paraburkholderia youngii TaxID=2782701 RepID=UPI003D1D4FA6